MKKLTSALLLAVLVTAILTYSVSAGGIITPYWTNISTMNNNFSFVGTAGNSTGVITGNAGTTYISGSVTVNRWTSTGFYYVASKTGSSTNGVLAISVDFTAIPGVYYQSIFTATVYIGGFGESETKTVYATCPV